MLHYAARLIYGRPKYDHVTSLLRDDRTGFTYCRECVTSLAYSYIRQWTAYHRLTSPVTVAVYPVFKADLRCALPLTTNLSLQGRKPRLVTDLSLWLVHRLGTIYRTLLRNRHLSSNSNRGWRHTYLRNHTANDYLCIIVPLSLTLFMFTDIVLLLLLLLLILLLLLLLLYISTVILKINLLQIAAQTIFVVFHSKRWGYIQNPD